MREIKQRFVTVEVKGKKVKYFEKYVVDESGEEVFDREIELANDIALYDEYKLNAGLLPSSRIKKIRAKYGLTQKEYALVLGMGEISIHRFEKGSIQTEAVDNIMRLSENPVNLKELLKKQIFKLPQELYDRLTVTIDNLLALKEHALLDLSNIDINPFNMQTETVSNIARIVIQKYEEYINKNAKTYGVERQYLTNEKLQKLLYYVQAYCLYLYDKKAFREKIYSTSQGPIIPEISEMDENCFCEEREQYGSKDISSSLESILDEVIKKYGSIETNKLIDLCCSEMSYLKVKQGEEIKEKEIKQYLEKIYSI